MGSASDQGSGKERLKWTQELHDLFEKAVNQLGGPDRATPKGILKAMGISALTIYHVKSHLQKYRMSKFVPESSSRRNKFEKRSITDIFPNFSTTSGAQLNEALQMQMEVQRRLSDQLEVQKNLKMKIEAQSKFLEKLTEEHKIRPNIKINKMSPTSLPSLCDVSESIIDFESDSEFDTNEMKATQDHPFAKRVRIDNNELVSNQRFKRPSLITQSIIIPTNGNSFPSQDMFPWGLSFTQSPLIPTSYHSFA
ncbi:myb family transcription factor PHL7-like isoform X2 [Rutidosis leptorrhynchoides]|uniref:myb family transcription factor PHL7-like isoform X2 n=1 Tax=Rutidosis leptorrhynchoides TaxID=125765 RepID=UPI003A994987